VGWERSGDGPDASLVLPAGADLKLLRDAFTSIAAAIDGDAWAQWVRDGNGAHALMRSTIAPAGADPELVHATTAAMIAGSVVEGFL
jgi:hypothetical protein